MHVEVIKVLLILARKKKKKLKKEILTMLCVRGVRPISTCHSDWIYQDQYSIIQDNINCNNNQIAVMLNNLNHTLALAIIPK